MTVMRIVIDGNHFDGQMNGPISESDLEKAAASLGESLAKLEYLSIGLVSGGLLVLGNEQLKRAVFLFLQDSE